MKKVIFLALFILMILVTSCELFEQYTTKNFGGTMEVKLIRGEKLVMATWKDDNFWYLTKPMVDSDVPEVYMFREKSLSGVQGVVKIIESK